MSERRRPAPWTEPVPGSSGNSSRPDPRPGRRRARLFRLLPALALLLGALSLFAAAPAQAQQLAAPQNFELEAGDKQFTASWDAVNGAMGYRMNVTASETGYNVNATYTTSSTSITASSDIFTGDFRNGVTYSVRVSACSEADGGRCTGGYGLWTAKKTVTPTAQSTGPSAPTFSPDDGTTTTNAAGNITLTFGEAIKADDEATPTDFTATTLKNILTLKETDASGAAIPYSATISSDKTTVTIDPTSNLPDGDVYVAVSGDWYDAEGNQGAAAAATFTVDATAPSATFSPADGDTVTDAGRNITLTFDEAIRSDASGTDFDDTTIDAIVTLKAGSSTGSAITFDATIDGAKKVVTINPTSDLPAGAVYVAVSGSYWDAHGNQGSADSATFTVGSTTPDPPAFLPANGATVTNAGTNITLTFAEAIKKDASNTDFANADLKSILTLTETDASGTAIPYSVSINSAKTIITINPDSNLSDGDVYVAVSGDWYDAEGNQGAAAEATFTVDATAPAPAFLPANGATTTNAGTNITLSFGEAIKKDGSGADFANADLSGILTLTETNAGGTAIPYAATINTAKTKITINPNADLPEGAVYVAISGDYWDAGGNRGSAASATFTVDAALDAPSVTVTGGANRVTVSWDAVANADGYYVAIGVTNSGEAVTHDVGNATSRTFTDLEGGTSYSVRVEARDSTGTRRNTWSAWTGASTHDKLATPVVTRTGAGNSITVSWEAVEGANQYLVAYGVDGSGNAQTVTVGDVTSHTVTGLEGATRYASRVQARDTTGAASDSDWSGWDGSDTADLLATPSPTYTPGDRQLTVSWDAVAGADKYLLAHGEAGSGTSMTVTLGDVTTYTITGLTNGTGWSVRMQAQDTTGAASTSLWSSWGGATPRTVPGAVTGLEATAGAGKLGLSWTAPASNGGSAVTGYDVHYTSAPKSGTGAVLDDAAVQTGASPSAADGWVDAKHTGTTASGEITGLGVTAYRVRVRAVNAAGGGAWEHDTGTPEAVTGPDPPSFLPANGSTVTNAGTNITLTFGEAIKKDDETTPADFTAATVKNILTLKTGNDSGTAIPYTATINSAKTKITIDPTSNLADGAVYVAVSGDWYDAEGNQGAEAAATFTVDTAGPSAAFSPASGDTVTDAGRNITLTFDEAIRSDASGTDFDDTTIDAIVTLKAGSSTGSAIPFDATIDSGKKVVTINPTGNLAEGAVYVAISAGYWDAHGNRGAADTATFTVDTSGPDPPSFLPANGATVTSASGNITLTFGEAIKKDDEETPADFSDTTIDAIVTLKAGSSTGANIPFDATIDSAKKVVTINPSSDLSDGAVYVAVSDAWYDGDGVQGAMASAIFTVDTTPPAVSFSPASGDTTENAGTNVTVTFDEAIRSDASGTDFDDTTIDAIVTLKAGSSAGANIPFDATIDGAKKVVTINPSSDLDDGDVYVAVSAGYWDAHGNQGGVRSATFEVDAESSDAALSALTARSAESETGTYTSLSIGTFSGATTAYEATVANAVTHVKLRPTVNDSDAAVKVGKGASLTAVTSGNESAALALTVGANPLKVEVTAEDSSKRTYTVTVKRRFAMPAGVSASGDGKLALTWTAPTGGTLTGYDVHYTSSTTVANDAAAGTNVANAWVDAAHTGTTATGEITGLANGTPYRLRVRAKNADVAGEWGFGTGTPKSSDATLSGLEASSAESETGTFTSLDIGTFSAATTSYEATVANAVTHVKLTPTTGDSDATVKVGKGGGTLTTVTSGNASAALALTVGANALKIEVTAEDSTKRTYTVTVKRRFAMPTGVMASGDGKLALTWTAPAGGTLTGYDVHYTSSTTVADEAAAGTNVANAWVAAAHTGTAATGEITGLSNGTAYRVRVRAKNADVAGEWGFGAGTPKSSDATLSTLTGSTSTDGTAFDGALDFGTFSPATTDYEAEVAGAVTHVKLTPAVNDSDATVKVGPQGGTLTPVTSGQASAAIALSPGANAIDAEVTAEDGTKKTYTVTVTRLSVPSGVTAAPGAAGGGPTVSVTFTAPGGWKAVHQIKPAGDDWPSARSTAHALPGGVARDTDLGTGDQSGGTFVFKGFQENAAYDVRLHLVEDTSGTPQIIEASSTAVQVTTWTVPGAPTAATAAAASSSALDAGWTAPAEAGGAGAAITGYRVRWREKDTSPHRAGDQAGSWNAEEGVEADSATAHAISGLESNTAYEVEVRALNGVDPGSAWSAAATGVTDLPAGVSWSASLRVQGLSGTDAGCNNTVSGKACSTETVLTDDDFTVGARTYTISRVRHLSSGVLLFRLDRTPDAALGALRLCVGAADTGFSLSGHQSGAISWNGANLGWSAGDTVPLRIATTCAAGAPTVPDRPADLAAVPDSGRLDLSWRAPPGSVAGYDVHYTSSTTAGDDDDVGSNTSPATGWVAVSRTESDPPAARQGISGLTNGTAYRVRVRAKNAIGAGDWARQTATPAVPVAPPVPRNVAVAPGDGKLTLAWEAPASWGSWPAEAYTAEWKLSGSAASAWHPVTDQATSEDAVLGPGATGFVFEGRQLDVNDTPHDVANGTAYDLRIRAVSRKPGTDGSQQGHFRSSGWVAVTDQEPAAIPGQPADLTVAPGDAKLDLSWTAPQGPVTGYDVHYTSAPSTGQGAVGDDDDVGSNTNPATGWVAASRTEADPPAAEHALTGLTNGTAYRVRVRAVNAAGAGPWERGTATPGFPGPPADLVVTPGDQKLDLSWTAPAGTLTGYDVHYTSSTSVGDDDAASGNDPATAWVAASRTEADPPEAAHSLTGLTDGTAYRVRVRAVNAAGAGAWERGTATPGFPAAPADLVVTAGDAKLDLSWTAPQGPVTGYDVEYKEADAGDAPATTPDDPATGWVALDRGTEADPPETSQEIAGLDNGTEYRVRVRAKNDAGAGAWARETGAPADPGTPTGLTVTPGDGELVLSWTAPPESVDGYALHYTASATVGENADPGGDPATDWVSVSDDLITATTYTLTDLENGTAYRVRIRAYRGVNFAGPYYVFGTGTPRTPPAPAPPTGGGPADLVPSFGSASVADQSYVAGAAIAALALPRATGGDGELTYSLAPAPPQGLALDLGLRMLTGTPSRAQGAVEYTWRATDADGDAATLTFAIEVEDPNRAQVKEAVKQALAAVARRAMSGALDNIGARFGDIGASGVSLAGQAVSLDGSAAAAALRDCAAERFVPAGFGPDTDCVEGRALAAADLLGASAFSVHLASAEEGAAGAPAAPLWAVWGRGDLGTFAGRGETGLRYDGKLRTGWLGMDARAGPWVAGLAVSHGRGEADYAGGALSGRGRLETTMTAVYPYGRWTLANGLELRGVAGLGTGEARHEPGDADAETGDLSMRMASVGVRRGLGGLAGVELAVRADASVTRMETDSGPDAVHNLSAESWRLRAGLEASRRFALEGARSLEPFLEAAVRRDGGDGLEGSGFELAGGVRYAAPGISVEARGRWLAAHSGEGAEERGVSLTVRAGPGAGGRGLFFALAPRWGAPAGGARALWAEEMPAPAGSANGGALDAKVGYGFALPRARGVLTPFAEAGLAGGESRRLRLGARFESSRADLRVELAGERRESAASEPEHELGLDLSLRF